MEQNKLARIGELARKAKLEGLTDAEREEQTRLREEYLSAIRANLKQTLDSIQYVDSDKKQ